MRLYKIDIIMDYDGIMMVETLIVPEYALGQYEFQAAEYVGNLEGAFEISAKKVETDDVSEKDNVVQLTKKDD